jgi:hypothetical protein
MIKGSNESSSRIRCDTSNTMKKEPNLACIKSRKASQGTQAESEDKKLNVFLRKQVLHK